MHSECIASVSVSCFCSELSHAVQNTSRARQSCQGISTLGGMIGDCKSLLRWLTSASQSVLKSTVFSWIFNFTLQVGSLLSHVIDPRNNSSWLSVILAISLNGLEWLATAKCPYFVHVLYLATEIPLSALVQYLYAVQTGEGDLSL